MADGPALSLSATCDACDHERSEWYAVQGDSGRRVYCDHPSSPGRRVGDTNWSTPEWCPYLVAATERFLADLRARLPVAEAVQHPQPVAIGPEDTTVVVEALEYTAARKPGAQVERIARIRAALTGRLS